MNTAAIRQQLHEYSERANDKKVEGLYMFVEDEINNPQTFRLSEEQLRILDEEREAHLSGESQSYSWEKAKQIIRDGQNL